MSLDRVYQILNVTKLAYAAIVLGLFLIAFVIYGILNAPDNGDEIKIHAMRGPGGRPLPQRRVSAKQLKEAVKIKDFSRTAKVTFRVMALGILLTFLAQAIEILLQVIIYRKQQWWPGQSAVVSYFNSMGKVQLTLKDIRYRGFLCLGYYLDILDRYKASADICTSDNLDRFPSPGSDRLGC